MKMQRILSLLALTICAVAGRVPAQQLPGMALIPAGKFEMGDHYGYHDEKHESHEVPIHLVYVDAFSIDIFDVTTQKYVEFLNAALAQQAIEVRTGGVYLLGGQDLLCDTRELSPYSRIGWDGKQFTVLDKKEDHPMVCVRWHGAAAYCNWLSVQLKRPPCYNPTTWDCDYNKSGFRLPTEAEWEYAARGGKQNPYCNYPWGDDSNPAKANVPQSDNPYRTGPLPWTTPVGFFNGKLQRKADVDWPGLPETYQTVNSVNGFGLHDMAGNVWQWCNDWYTHNYYAYSPTNNPVGPAQGSLLPDGKPYHSMRGGCWYNGDYMRSRISNHVPSYYRGPQDPNHPYYAFGFRVVCPVDAEHRPVIKPTPVQNIRGQGNPPGGGERRQRQGGQQRQGGGAGERPPRPEDGQPPRNEASAAPRHQSGAFVLSSPEVKENGVLPVEFTGDGKASTLPLAWTGAPAGTKSLALIMHHIDPKGVVKWYWTLYNIPADVKSLPKNVKGVGTLGNNSVNKDLGYAPPHSKGPGVKTYILTIYALSAPPRLTVPPAEVNREALLAAMKDKILASTELRVNYTRSVSASSSTEESRPGPGRSQGDTPPGDRPPRPDGERRPPSDQ
jgi:formylglycine-generating enzyme required for sulfatase activity/phosphatidylethanolamine-binding protein (PEBP) family uncharacterized protein